MSRHREPGLRATTIRGFTLIEMLLVVAILAAVAVSATAMLEGAESQVRYDDTKARLEMLRSAILGPEDATGTQGFIADVGRPPASLRDLFVKPNDVDQYKVVGVVGTGWRGPYLRSPPSTSGQLTFPDGWGNEHPQRIADPSFDDPNFGWLYGPDGTDFIIQSRGAAAGSTGVGYDPLVRIERSSWAVDLRQWSGVGFTVEDSTATITTEVAIRLQIQFPEPTSPSGVGQLNVDSEPSRLFPDKPTPFWINVSKVEVPQGQMSWIPAGIRAIHVQLVDPTSSSTQPQDLGDVLITLRPRAPFPVELKRRFVVP